jgi:CBS domain-containing protein
MTARPLVTCPPTARLGEVAAMLRQNRVHAVIVAGVHGPTGILSDTNLLAGEWLAEDEEKLAAMRAMTAGELMSKPIAEIDAAASLADAARLMTTQRVARLLVMEGGEPAGIVSISDLVSAIGGSRTGRRKVSDVMCWGVVACAESTSLAAAARLMTDRRSRSVVVVDDPGHAVGVVTGTDLLACLTGELDARSPVSAVMKTPITIAPDASLVEAADLMLRKEIHRLLVVKAWQPETFPLGLIATSDIVAEMAEPGGEWSADRTR